MYYLKLLIFFTINLAFTSELFVSMPAGMANNILKTKYTNTNQIISTKTSESKLQTFSQYVHKNNRFCGGFIVTNKKLSAPLPVQNSKIYSISRKVEVKKIIQKVQEKRIRSFIEYFSSYKNRYYKSKVGIKAMKDLAEKWKAITKKRRDIKVNLIHHKNWKQPSVQVIIKGKASKKIIIGGHGDSINTDDEGVHSHAPGADDNASGIAVITEVLRILSNTNYTPENNIHFIAYSAEEVGLRGSMDIAQKHANKKSNILGVIQFDGTNFNGSDIKIALIKDNTDSKQNEFIGKLIDTYLNIPWGYDSCDYACSDHYSWTYNGFVASFPGEARVKEENPHIHTERDTIEVSNGNANHATHFAKLGLAYILELDK